MEFRLTPLDNPYWFEPGAEFEMWGSIFLKLDDTVLLDLQWDVLPLVEWFYYSKGTLMNDNLPFENPAQLSIAELRDLLFSQCADMDDIDESVACSENLSPYFDRHHFKLRGTNSQLFYIGLNTAGRGEISFSIDDSYRVFNFEMNDFLLLVEGQIHSFTDDGRIRIFN